MLRAYCMGIMSPRLTSHPIPAIWSSPTTSIKYKIVQSLCNQGMKEKIFILSRLIQVVKLPIQVLRFQANMKHMNLFHKKKKKKKVEVLS